MFKLIPDARISWRFTSVQATALLAFVSSVQSELFPLLKPLFTAEQWDVILPAWVLLILVLRHIAQPGLQPLREQRQDQQEYAAGVRSSLQPGPTAVDDEIEHIAIMLYEAGGLSKAWEHVSPESKAKWRKVAETSRTYAVDRPGAR